MPPQTISPSLILPQIIEWANEHMYNALACGRCLTEVETDFATKIGILRPDLVRIHTLEQMPSPPAGLELISREFLDVTLANGLTLWYAILVLNGCESQRLIRHELGHVLQVERIGDLQSFLEIYLEQILHYGYRNAPFEVEAVSYEVN